jgi:Tetratricopeptide repeat
VSWIKRLFSSTGKRKSDISIPGPEHPDAPKEDSETLFRGIIADFERTLGPEHPDTIAMVYELALLLMKKGDCAGAEPLLRRHLKVQDRVLGPRHPATIKTVNNLAVMCSRQGNDAGAEPLFRRALAAMLKISATMQHTHPDLRTAVENYTACLEKLGRSPEERRRTLEALDCSGWIPCDFR